MKFIISKTALEMAVKNICRVINPKNALPILADILCMVDEERKTITMTGSDAEAWLTYQVTLQECEGGGPFCIGADLLRDALAELTEQPLTILATTESDNRFTLKHESGTTVLPLELSDEYPTPRHIDSTVNEWTLESGMLKRVLKRSMFATANDDLRPVMNGVYFDMCEELEKDTCGGISPFDSFNFEPFELTYENRDDWQQKPSLQDIDKQKHPEKYK